MAQAEDRVIAEIGDRRVMYREVACNRDWAAANPKWLGGKSLDVACAEAEQQKFRQMIMATLIEKICALEGCEPSEGEISAFRSPILKDESMMRALAAEGRKVPEAVRRVYLGEPVEAVYEDAIKPMNRSLEAFLEEIGKYRSLEVVERFLAKDWIASTRQHYEQQARQRAMRAAIAKRIEAAAQAKNESPQDAADNYLRSMIERLGARVLDAQFTLPSGKEAFL